MTFLCEYSAVSAAESKETFWRLCLVGVSRAEVLAVGAHVDWP